MTALPRHVETAEPEEELLDDRLRRVIVKRVGESDYSPDTELTVMGIDSLMLLRIIADLVVEPSLEIDAVQLADVVTVADLHDFLADLSKGS